MLVLAGEDGRVLGEHARQAEKELRTIPGIGNVTSTSSLVRPELVVRPDFAKAADLGVTSAAIADTLRPGAVHHPDGDLDAVDDRPDHADGHRNQELDPAGGVRHPGPWRWWS